MVDIPIAPPEAFSWRAKPAYFPDGKWRENVHANVFRARVVSGRTNKRFRRRKERQKMSKNIKLELTPQDANLLLGWAAQTVQRALKEADAHGWNDPWSGDLLRIAQIFDLAGAPKCLSVDVVKELIRQREKDKDGQND